MAKRANGEGTICRHSNGLWMAAVTIGRDAATGKSICKYCYGKTKAEVQQKKDALIEQSRGPVYIDADKVTVGQLGGKMAEHLCQGQCPGKHLYPAQEAAHRIHTADHAGMGTPFRGRQSRSRNVYRPVPRMGHRHHPLRTAGIKVDRL